MAELEFLLVRWSLQGCAFLHSAYFTKFVQFLKQDTHLLNTILEIHAKHLSYASQGFSQPSCH